MDRDYYINFLKYVRFVMKHIYNVHIDGLENIPTDTNYLLAGNHLHILDSFLLVYALDDEIIRFMVDKKLYRYKLWEDFFTKMGTFPIDPSKSDINAVKTAVKLLKEKENVAIFPEGKTHRQDEYVPFKGGISQIAYLTNVPLVPFGIEGSYKPFSDLSITFGEPIILDKQDKKHWDINLESTVRKLEKKN